MSNYRRGKKRLFESEGFHLHFPTELFLGQVRPKMCRTTSVCSGESTLRRNRGGGRGRGSNGELVRPRPRSANVKKEKIRGSAGTITPSPLLHSRVHACEGGSKAGKRGTERMARLGSVGKIKLGRPERSPLDRLLRTLSFSLYVLFSLGESER